MAWDNPADYEYCLSNTYEQWAWEFIRRNPEYQQEWEKELATWPQRLVENPHLQNQLKREENRTPCTPRFSVSPDHEDFGLQPSRQRNKWRLGYYYNPSLPRPPSLHFMESEFYIHFLKPENYTDEMMVEVKDFVQSVSFDLRFPLNPQLEEAKAVMKKRQSALKNEGVLSDRNPSLRTDQELGWINYLRLLDAEAVGAIKSVVAPLLFPDSDEAGTSPGEKYDGVRDEAWLWVKQRYQLLLVAAVNEKLEKLALLSPQ